MSNQNISWGYGCLQHSPHSKRTNPINRDKDRTSLAVGLDHSLICSNIKCRENHTERSLVWTGDDTNLGLPEQGLPKRTEETGVFYVSTNMSPLNKMRNKQ